MRACHLACLAVALLGGGCASRKLLKLEAQVVEQENSQLRRELKACQDLAPPPDYAMVVDYEVIAGFVSRAGYGSFERLPSGVLVIPVQGDHTTFKVTVQLFERQKVLFMAATEYIRIEDATSSKAMVLLLTQLAALNYDLLLGKFQLNPRTGAITLSMEISLEDGLGYRTFSNSLQHLLETADGRYPELKRAAEGTGL